MPLCPQVTITPITVTSTNMVQTSVIAANVPATTEQVNDVVVLLDDKTKAYYQATAPTTGLNEGDIWFDTDDGNKQYFYTGTAWVSVQDAAIAAAQTTADGKNKIYRQTTAPTGTLVAGDLWFDTDDDNKIYRYDGTNFIANTLGTNALADFSANKITSGTIDASVVTVSNINAGNISTGSLASARIAAGTIVASQIATGTITATQIAAGTITTDKLTAGTLTGFTVQTSAGASAVILNGASNAIQFKNASSIVGNIVPWGSGGIIMHYGASPDSSGGTYPQVRVTAAISEISAGANQFVSTSASLGTTVSGGTPGVFINGAATFDGAATVAGVFTATNAGTVTNTNTPNAWLSTAGILRRSTASSARYKENITNIRDVAELDPRRLLAIPVRAFSYKPEYLAQEDDRAGVLMPGLIAEEVDAIYPLAADYEKGNVENINDRAILVNLLALVQDLYKEIALLKGE
jgi:hypothetical protein